MFGILLLVFICFYACGLIKIYIQGTGENQVLSIDFRYGKIVANVSGLFKKSISHKYARTVIFTLVGYIFSLNITVR
jgi:hypothetical protein